MSKNFKFITAILSLTLCFAAMAFAQGTTGSIEGTVADPNGAVIPNATVNITSIGATTAFNRTVTADSSGYFNVPRVPPGTYRVTASAGNFAERSQEITVVVDKATVVSATLTAAGITGQVEVTADSSVTIDPGNTTIDTNITKQVFEDLPSGTTFSSLLKLAPNVRQENLGGAGQVAGGGFQVDGASGSENVFVIDGQEVTNFRTGALTPNNNLPFELLQEVQIKSTGFDAEYGGATGGVINVVTTGGNNQWRGNLGISFEPQSWRGDARPILNRYLAGAGQFEFFTPNKDRGTDYFPVAALSGPIVKDRLWFSAIYAPQIEDQTRNIDYFTSSNPNTRTFVDTFRYDTKLKTEQAFFRLDAQPHSTLRWFGSFLWNPIIQEGVRPVLQAGLSGVPPPVLFGGNIGTIGGRELLTIQGGRQNSNNFNTQGTWTPTARTVFNSRFGRSFLNEKLTSYNKPPVTRFFCRGAASGATPGSGCVSGFNSVPNNDQIVYDVSTRTTFDVDAGFVGLNAGGRHNLKFGFQWNRLFNTVDRGHVPFGVVVLDYGTPISGQGTGVTPTGATTANPTGNCATAAPGAPCNWGSGFMQRFGTVGEASSVNKAIFAQDSWQIARRLTINAGIRAEQENVPSFGSGSSIEFGWGSKVAPRLGVAFDLTGNGRTKLFGSYGLFYDRFKYELPRGSFGGDFFRNDYFEILPSRGTHYSNYTFANILGNNFTDPIGGNCPGTNAPVWPGGWSVCQFDFRIATNISGANIFESGGIDPDIKAARQSEYTFGVERQLWRNTLLSARYTHKEIDRTVEDVGVLNAQGSEAYIIGNPGLGLVCEVSQDAGLPCTKAQREYDALEVRFDRRSTNAFFSGSYTWSRLFGNYSGLASTDEAGRNSPNVNRYFDLPPLGYNADGEPDNGRLATDRPHVFKAYGGYGWNWGGGTNNRTTVSAFTTVQSGTPLTTIYNLYSLGTTILNGRGDLGRTPRFTETDISVSHRYKFGRDSRFTFEPFVDIRNLFDEDNVLAVQNTYSATNFSAATLRTLGCTTCGSPSDPGAIQEVAVFNTILNGSGIRQFVLASASRNDYGQPNLFQASRNVRFGARLFF